jgi:hypothetical protein
MGRLRDPIWWYWLLTELALVGSLPGGGLGFRRPSRWR